MTSATPSEPRRSKAEKFWDRLARTWGRPAEEPEQTDTSVLAKTRPYLKATDTVLDYGCAKGSVDLRLAAAVRAIHGIDISSNMIAAAREAADARQAANVSFAKATIFDESLERESFDVVLAFAIFHLLEDAPKAMRRIDELLKPGGLLISVTPCLGEKADMADQKRDASREVGRSAAGDPPRVALHDRGTARGHGRRGFGTHRGRGVGPQHLGVFRGGEEDTVTQRAGGTFGSGVTYLGYSAVQESRATRRPIGTRTAAGTRSRPGRPRWRRRADSASVRLAAGIALELWDVISRIGLRVSVDWVLVEPQTILDMLRLPGLA